MARRTKLRTGAISCVLAAVVVAVGCAARPRQSDLVRRIDASLARSASYIVLKQSADGAWRSETYGMFRDGMALTPLVMSTLFFLPQGGPEARGSFRRGVDFLMAQVDEKGNIRSRPHGMLFPVLTAASASRMVVLETKDAPRKSAQAAYLKIIREWQLTEDLGWSADDSEYGGWGFALRPPQKPKPGEMRERFFESNMVATIFGIAALRSARMPLSNPAWGRALVFVKRCQNFRDDATQADPRFDDGGFFFIPTDPLQNKAGVAGTDGLGGQRFHSYGTMTADGLRALLQCGLAKDHPRVVAARAWLERNFSTVKNPGTFNPDREVLRNATYYYWAWAVAHAFTRVGVREFGQNGRTVRWAEDLAQELLRRQRPDGSWVNGYTDAREDDPLVSTPWAAAALAICRQAITAPGDADPAACAKPGAAPMPPIAR